MSRLVCPILLIMVLVLSACNMNADPGSDTGVVLPQFTDVPTSVPVSTTQGQTVTDTRVGFTFTYPVGWTLFAPGDVTSAVAYAYSMQSVEPTVGGEPLPEGESKIDLYVNLTEANSTLDNIQTRVQQEDAESDILTINSVEPTTLDNGTAALLVRGSGMGGNFATLYTIVKGYEVSVVVLGDEQYLWQVANSIQPT
jgi:hypothetical protein